MRFFIAFFLALIVYLVLFLIYFKNFSTIKLPSTKKNEHIIKISLKELTTSLPVKKKPKPVIKENISVKNQNKSTSIVKILKREVSQKVKVKKKRKPIKKKIIKKKENSIRQEAIIETLTKPFIMEKPIIEENFNEEVMQEEEFISEEFETEIPFMPEPTLVEENNSPALRKFEEEIVYISEPMFKTKESQAKNDDLSSFLATPSNSMNSFISPNRKIQQLYGATFQGMSSTQKAFIEENLETIQAITQRMLSQRGYPEGAGRTGQEGTNVVLFNLHPNGDISDLRLKTRIGYRALDENTLSLIRVAYKDYPYPTVTTQIIFYVTYSINGY